MARHNNYLILVAFFLLATTIAKISGIKEEEPLMECAKHMGSFCGNQVIDTLASHIKPKISVNCCYKLIQTGYSCHNRLTKFVLQNDSEFKHANSTEILLARNDYIFNKCDEHTKPKSKEFLSKCVDELGTECGNEVFDNLIFDKNVTNHCCETLVKMGRSCHINMVKALIRTPEMRDANAIEFLKKSKKIFNECADVQ